MIFHLRTGNFTDIAALANLSAAEEFSYAISRSPTYKQCHNGFYSTIIASMRGKAHVVVAEAAGEIVGYAVAHFGHKNAHLDYKIASVHRGHGLGSQVVGKLMKHPLPPFLENWLAICHSKNLPSLLILKSHGFQKRGLWRELSDEYLLFTRGR